MEDLLLSDVIAHSSARGVVPRPGRRTSAATRRAAAGEPLSRRPTATGMSAGRTGSGPRMTRRRRGAALVLVALALLRLLIRAGERYVLSDPPVAPHEGPPVQDAQRAER